MCTLASCQDRRVPSVYEIPAGYEGWVFIFWNQKNAPAIPKEKEGSVFTVPNDGILRTSSTKPDGWATDRYYWKHPDGRREFFGETGNALIHAQGGGTSNIGQRDEVEYSRFYVGKGGADFETRDEARRAAVKINNDRANKR